MTNFHIQPLNPAKLFVGHTSFVETKPSCYRVIIIGEKNDTGPYRYQPILSDIPTLIQSKGIVATFLWKKTWRLQEWTLHQRSGLENICSAGVEGTETQMSTGCSETSSQTLERGLDVLRLDLEHSTSTTDASSLRMCRDFNVFQTDDYIYKNPWFYCKVPWYLSHLLSITGGRDGRLCSWGTSETPGSWSALIPGHDQTHGQLRPTD